VNVLALMKLAEAAVETIAKIANVADEHAPAALMAIKAIIETLKDGQSGKLSPQAALTQIESLHNALDANEEAALAELRARFGK
jgi:hypothetical protein